MKKFKMLTFKRYKLFHWDSRNYKDMIETKNLKGWFFAFNYIYTPKKNVATHKNFFFHLRISLSLLEFEWKILYHSKANILNFKQKSCIFTISKNIISSTRIKKIFFLWKILIALIILQKSIWIKISSLTVFWESELHLVYQSWKILHFLNKIKEILCFRN